MMMDSMWSGKQRCHRWLFAVASCLLLFTTTPVSAQKTAPTLIYIFNESPTSFNVFWVNPQSYELVLLSDTPVLPRKLASYNSFVNEVLELHQVPDATTGECVSADQVCKRANVKVTAEDKNLSKYGDVCAL